MYHIPSASMLEKLLCGDISLGVCTADESDKDEVGTREGETATPKGEDEPEHSGDEPFSGPL